MITRIEATRYRCFDRVGVDLGAYQVLLGPNGSGKTTLIDIPVLLGDLLRANPIAQAFLSVTSGPTPRASSLRELVFRSPEDGDLILAVEVKLEQAQVTALLEGATKAVQATSSRWLDTLRYELRLQVYNGDALHVSGEYLYAFPSGSPPRRDGPRMFGEVDTPRAWRPILVRKPGEDALLYVETNRRRKPSDIHVEPGLLALGAIAYQGRRWFPAAMFLLEVLTSGTAFYRPDLRLLRLASPPGLPRDRLLPSGQNLPWLGRALKEADPEGYRRFVSQVQIVLPQVTDIEVVERPDDHHAYFMVSWQGGYTVPSSGLSDGTLLLLGLSLLPYLIRPPRLLVTEEPENGVHPRAIDAASECLRSMYDTQVIVASHSPVLLATTLLEDVLVARLEPDGSASVVRGQDHPNLRGWQGAVDLPTWFATGVLE